MPELWRPDAESRLAFGEFRIRPVRRTLARGLEATMRSVLDELEASFGEAVAPDRPR